MHKHELMLILDFGSQVTQLISRRLREIGVYAEVVPGTISLERLKEKSPKALILSGSPHSVYETGSPQLASGFFKWIESADLPVLGICYGFQLIAREFGAEVASGKNREYGAMGVSSVASDSKYFAGSTLPTKFQAWMSHGDEVLSTPRGFRLILKSDTGAHAGFEHESRKIFGLQFHPEVTHTESGEALLKRFAVDLAGFCCDWTMGNFLIEEKARWERELPAGAHVLCALSGGVDSMVAATLMKQSLGDRLHCLLVDHGLMRFEEVERLKPAFAAVGLQVTILDARERFLGQLKGVSDPEEKRKRIGETFIRVFEEESEKLEKSIGHKMDYLVQGTLYPDVIESLSPQEGGHSVKIKSHHNVGGLPEKMKFKLVEPLRMLFKDEVRRLGLELGLPHSVLYRHPFPGPGLAVRIIDAITPERVEILQRADDVFIDVLRKTGYYEKVWQAFAVFLPIRTVGVQGDGRTHDYVVALRAVTSVDGMTAAFARLPWEVIDEASRRICNEVRGVSRVVYDVTGKPPATIEWE